MDDDEPVQPKERKSRRRLLIILFSSFLAISCIVGVGFYLGNKEKQPDQLQLLQGKIALSEKGLRDAVRNYDLVAYWTGPIAENTYSVFVPKPGVVVVRYIPKEASVLDTSQNFRLVATYVQKDAFNATQTGGLQAANAGFINVDGNAVFYVKARPTNVYVGIKDRDVQLEIFDPGQDQAVALALFKGQIQQIK